MKIFFAKNFDKNLDTGINFEMSKDNNTTDNKDLKVRPHRSDIKTHKRSTHLKAIQLWQTRILKIS